MSSDSLIFPTEIEILVMFFVSCLSSMLPSSSIMSIATLFVFDETSKCAVPLVLLKSSVGSSWLRDKCSTTVQATQHAQTFVGVVIRSLNESYKECKLNRYSRNCTIITIRDLGIACNQQRQFEYNLLYWKIKLQKMIEKLL